MIIKVDDYTVLGEAVANAQVKAFDPDQNILICDLLNDDGRIVAEDRYWFLGEQPFEFNESDLALLEAEDV